MGRTTCLEDQDRPHLNTGMWVLPILVWCHNLQQKIGKPLTQCDYCAIQVMKKPGQDNVPIMSEMDLTYKERYTGAYIPEAYERLILDAIRGDQQHFVRRFVDSNSA